MKIEDILKELEANGQFSYFDVKIKELECKISKGMGFYFSFRFKGQDTDVFKADNIPVILKSDIEVVFKSAPTNKNPYIGGMKKKKALLTQR